MDFEAIKKIVEDNYNIKITFIKKKKNVYRIESGDKNFCLKVIPYEFKHFNFIISAIRHLENKGFKSTPTMILTTDNKKYIELFGKYAYLTNWIDAREANYNNDGELAKTAKKLRELHICSKNFVLTENMKPRLYWGTWCKTFETRISEILDFKKRISQKAKKSEFDKLYLSIMDVEIERGRNSIMNLKKNNYFSYMENESINLSFCHHDYAHHNVMIDKNEELNIIDFDYCILDTHLHDLASLEIRAMKDKSWNTENFDFIKNAYDINLTKQEELLMLAFMEFPQEYWQIGLQYYWEQLDWNEERFLRKLSDYIKNREDKNNLIKLLRERNR